MEKFNKLSRAEMRNVTGGAMVQSCVVHCHWEGGGAHGQSFNDFDATVPDCSDASTSGACMGWYVVGCLCTELHPQ